MATFSSTFTGSDENPLSEGGVWDGGYTGMQSLKRISNLCRASVTATFDCLMTYNGSNFKADQSISFRIVTLAHGPGFAQANLIGRASAPPDRIYYMISTRTEASYMYKGVGASDTLIASGGLPFSPGNVAKLVLVARSQTAYRDGSMALLTTDSTIIDAGRGGIVSTLDGVSAQADMDDFQITDELEPITFPYQDFPKPKMRTPILAGRVI